MAIARYQKKISGPLIDRIDIHVEVPRVDYEKLADKRNVEDSKAVRARVQVAACGGVDIAVLALRQRADHHIEALGQAGVQILPARNRLRVVVLTLDQNRTFKPN